MNTTLHHQFNVQTERLKGLINESNSTTNDRYIYIYIFSLAENSGIENNLVCTFWSTNKEKMRKTVETLKVDETNKPIEMGIKKMQKTYKEQRKNSPNIQTGLDTFENVSVEEYKRALLTNG